MFLKSLKTLSIAGALALTLAACGGDSDLDTPTGSSPTHADEPGDVTTPNDSVDPDSEDPSNNSADTTAQDIDLASDELPITAKDALETSADEVGGGEDAIVHSVKIKFSDSRDAWEWSVKTLVDDTDHKVKVDADTGEVIKHEEDSTDDHEEAIDLDDPMTFDEAKDIALDARDGRIASWKYEWDDGQYEYEFDIEADGETEEVKVYAETGDSKLD